MHVALSVDQTHNIAVDRQSPQLGRNKHEQIYPKYGFLIIDVRIMYIET